jgi:hypothetical protein
MKTLLGSYLHFSERWLGWKYTVLELKNSPGHLTIDVPEVSHQGRDGLH